MRPQIKSLHSSDLTAGRRPPDPSVVYLPVQLEIGPDNESGADLFDVIVATPRGLANVQAAPVISERALVVVDEFEWASVVATLEQIVQRCEAGTWPQCCERLMRYFRWEYEDYR